MTTTDFRHGFLGMAATGSSLAVSALSHFEQWLRITSLLVGISVGALTFALLLRRYLKGDTRTEL